MWRPALAHHVLTGRHFTGPFKNMVQSQKADSGSQAAQTDATSQMPTRTTTARTILIAHLIQL
jgi:hypothetical protein